MSAPVRKVPRVSSRPSRPELPVLVALHDALSARRLAFARAAAASVRVQRSEEKRQTPDWDGFIRAHHELDALLPQGAEAADP